MNKQLTDEFADEMLAKQKPYCANPSCTYHNHDKGASLKQERVVVATQLNAKFYLCDVCASALTVGTLVDKALQEINEAETVSTEVKD